MTIKEALVLLEDAPSDDTPSAINPVLTTSQSVTIVLDGILSYLKDNDENYVLSGLYEKRVWQVIKNQRRPRY